MSRPVGSSVCELGSIALTRAVKDDYTFRTFHNLIRMHSDINMCLCASQRVGQEIRESVS